jgi:hypothetical protein
MNKLIIGLVLIFVICQISAVTLKGGNFKTYHKNFLDLVKGESTCHKFNNCVVYQVTLDYTNYGCSVCDEDYTLEVDKFETGICVKSRYPKNCLVKARGNDFHGGRPYCYTCNPYHYYLTKDAEQCKKLKMKQQEQCFKSVKHCKYWVEKENGIVCQGCEDGYTVNQAGDKCIKGCEIENCRSCQLINGKPFCFNCNYGSIGVYDQENFAYTQCLTCNDWQCKLLTEKAQECCLGKKVIEIDVKQTVHKKEKVAPVEHKQIENKQTEQKQQ